MKIPKIKKKDLKKMKIIGHTEKCNKFIFGGVAVGNERPKGPTEKWVCAEDCPLKDSKLNI